jgi:hypothetical protein
LDDALGLIDMVAKMLTQVTILDALTEVPGRWIDAVHDKQSPKVITLGMDSSESPESQVHGGQEGAMWNGLFQFKCLHSIFVLNQYGDLECCALRPGNLHSADCREYVLQPVLARYSRSARLPLQRRRFRADAAFAIPALFDLLEDEDWDYAIRIKGNPKMFARIDWLTKRRPARPPNDVVRDWGSGMRVTAIRYGYRRFRDSVAVSAFPNSPSQTAFEAPNSRSALMKSLTKILGACR